MKRITAYSIRFQLLLLVLITLGPATVIIVLQDVHERNEAVLNTEKEATNLVQTLSAQQNQTCETARRLLMTLAQVNDVRNRDIPACDSLFASLIRGTSEYGSINMTDRTGDIIASSSPSAAYNVSDRKYFREAVDTKKFSTGEFVISRPTGNPTIHFAYPILDAEQNVKAVLVVALKLDYFTQLFARANLADKSELVLSDWRGVILFSDPIAAQIGTREADSLMAPMQRDPHVYGLFKVNNHGEDYLNAFHRIYLEDTGELYMYVRVSVNMDVTLAGARRSMFINIALILLVYLIALSAAWRFADRSIIRKVKLAVNAAQKIAGGRLDAGTGIPHTEGELGALFQSFEEMSSALRKRDEDGELSRTMLQEVGERYRMLFDHIPQPLVVMDALSQRILTVNNAAVSQYGYTEDEFLQLAYTDLLTDAATRRLLKPVARTSHGVDPVTGITKHVRKNGEVMDVEIHASEITYRGAPSHMVSITDITERVRGEKIQQALYKIYRATNMAGNLQELYAMIHRILGEIVPAQNFSIALHDADLDTLSYPYFVDEYEVTPLPQRSGKGVAAYVLRTGEPLLATQETIQTMTADGAIDAAPFAGLEWLGAPLKIDDRSIGLVALRSYDDTVRFKEKDKIFLLFISSQIAKAIDKKRADDALRESERQLRRSQVSLSEAQALATLGSWHKDMITGVTVWSDTLFAIFGLPSTRPAPRSAEFYSIVHPEDAPMVRAALERTLAGTTTHLDYRIIINEVEVRYVTSITKPSFDSNHTVVELLGTILDITERKEAEEQIRRSLREKEVLLKEIHHRVKNNMQIISSLLNLQASGIIDQAARDVLKESQQRVRSMALIHENLYQSDNFSEIDLNDYIRSIVVHLFHSYCKSGISSAIDIASIRLNLDAAIPCGLIINELVSNALKYAFPDAASGTITISIGRSGDGNVYLDVSDDGIGIPPVLDIASIQTLGLQLVNSLVQQLQGTLEITGTSGTRVHIEFNHT